MAARDGHRRGGKTRNASGLAHCDCRTFDAYVRKALRNRKFGGPFHKPASGGTYLLAYAARQRHIVHRIRERVAGRGGAEIKLKLRIHEKRLLAQTLRRQVAYDAGDFQSVKAKRIHSSPHRHCMRWRGWL